MIASELADVGAASAPVESEDALGADAGVATLVRVIASSLDVGTLHALMKHKLIRSSSAGIRWLIMPFLSFSVSLLCYDAKASIKSAIA
jgi:hypothetical protein